MTYDAKHPDVMARLPAFLAAQLSITFTHSGAMDDDMLQHIHHDVTKGLSFQAACDRAASFLRHNHNQAELEFLSLWSYQQQPGTQSSLDRPACLGRLPNLGLLAVHATPSLTYRTTSMLLAYGWKIIAPWLPLHFFTLPPV